jgi:hypothetical protein
MKKIHTMCIEKMVESGEMSDVEANAAAVEDKGVAAGGSSESTPTADSLDDALESDPENGHWKGTVYWMKLGGSANTNEAKEGILNLDQETIEIDGGIRESVLDLFFYSKTKDASTAENYVKI